MSSKRGTEQSRLLIIDDDEDITDYIKTVGEEMGCSVRYAHEFSLAIDAIENFSPDVIVLDLHLKAHDGIEVLNFLTERKSEAKIILISGLDKATLDSASQVGKQRKLNIIGTLLKPFMIEDIEEELTRALDTSARFTSDELQATLGSGEFVLFYQTIISVEPDGNFAISGVEVKPYWEANSVLLHTPSQFLPLLRDHDLLQKFSYSLIDEALKSLKDWTISELNIGITLNMGALDLSDISWLNHLNNVAAKLAVPRNHINICFKQAADSDGLDSKLDTLTRLRISGFRVSVETAETDIEKLNKLLHLPFDEIRISESLIDQIGSNMEAEFNVSTLISIARKMGLQTCASGVKSYSTLSFLNDCKCHFAIGSFIGRELRARQVEAFIHDKTSISDGL